MGLIREILGIRRGIKGVAEVFVPNATKAQSDAHKQFSDALEQYAREYQLAQEGGFNRLVNGLNRLPRPILALGTVGLFVYAMLDPAGFSIRMTGLDTVPRELWWLLGAIVSFYFGARELHYQRSPKTAKPVMQRPEMPAQIDENAAVRDWQRQAGA